MAPTVAPVAAQAPAAQRQRQGHAHAHAHARRPLSRIVPAIPHRLSRTAPAARPVTPDESNKGTPPQPQKDAAGEPPHAAVHKHVEEQLPPASAVDAPMTPDSRASEGDKSQVETTVMAASPAKSAEDHVERAPPLQDAIPTPKTHTNYLRQMGLLDETRATPSVHDIESKPATNGVHRKRAIPAQLPPPFYPSTKADRQTPPAEAGDMVPPPSHRSQLSAGAAAFSVTNGSPATPTTPYPIDQERTVQQHTLPRPPPGFAPPEYTPSFFPGHVHHPSDTGAQWPYPPYSIAQPDHTYANGPDYPSPSLPVDSTVHPGSFDGSLPSREAPNGVATSLPQSPGKSQYGDVKPGSDHGDGKRMLPYQNGMAPHEGIEESPFELAAYLSTQFGNPEFADFILQIRSPESVLVSIPVHGIVVVRSPIIAEAVRRSAPTVHRSRDTRRMLDVLTSDPFVTRESLEEAVKVLYGAPLLSAQTFLYGLVPYVYDNEQPSASSDARMRMRQLLSYVEAGRALQLPSMQARGVEIARSLLRWDTVDEALHVALQSSTASRSKKDGYDADNPFTAALLNYAIEFMAYTFPVDFKLHTVAPELQDIPRLPVLRESRPSTHNPRLSKIRFGDAPPGDGVQPSHASRVLSSVLLSLPLSLVDRLFNHRATANQIGWTGVVKAMRDVIVERESRRQQALKGEIKPALDGSIPGALLNNMHLEERVDQVEESPLHPSGYRLIARSAA